MSIRLPYFLKKVSINYQWLVLVMGLLFVSVKAQPLHEYFFNGNLTGTGGGPTLTQNLTCGAAVGAFGVQTVAVTGQTCSASNVFCFNDGGGLNYPNPSYITDQYTIHMFFKFNTLGGYARVIDFRNSTSDNGAYILNNCLNFYPTGNIGACPFFVANTYYLITFVRTSANIVTVYVNGTLFTTYNDAANDYRCATNTTPIIFFRDDTPVPCENQPGCIRYASVISTTSNPTQVMSTFTNICNVILPVELSSFSHEVLNESVKLNWTTMSEKNSESFEIEKSLDGINFLKINTVAAAGNSTKKINYNSVDNNPQSGINYYRLKQIDFDGTISYSQIVMAKFEREAPLFYPNPAGETINIKYAEIGGDIIIRNILGEVVLQASIAEKNQINISELATGTYFVFLQNKVQKLVVNR